jgi:16S rRNA (guanine966-N2)-methyltransferase
MTRIIAGFAGSLSLAVPRNGTRPTSDRVREALFSALESRDALEGARVLDLYAGSGALGLEAGSRGAASVVLVESAPAAVRVCRSNATAVTKSAPGPLPIEVAAQSVQAFLANSAATFDLVFLDPPYGLPDGELAQALELLAPRLSPDAVVIVERGSRDTEPTWPDGLEVDREKKYGDTRVWFAVWAPRP